MRVLRSAVVRSRILTDDSSNHSDPRSFAPNACRWLGHRKNNLPDRVEGAMGARTDLASSIIKSGFRHRFLMARMTRLPVLGRAVEFAFFERDEMVYLPKDSVVASSPTKTIEIG